MEFLSLSSWTDLSTASRRVRLFQRPNYRCLVVGLMLFTNPDKVAADPFPSATASWEALVGTAYGHFGDVQVQSLNRQE